MTQTARVPKILLIDSNVYFSKRLSDALKKEGFQVLASTQPEPASELFRLARLLTPNVAFYVPRNTVLAEIAALLPPAAGGTVDSGDPEQVEVEEEWMGNKLKALTCYFGGLAQGQEHLF